jgi:hypothetical protein
VVPAIIYLQIGNALGVEIDLMKRSLRSLTSTIRSIKNTRSTRTRRSTKSITHQSLKKGKVQKNAKAPKRENQARIGVVIGDIITIAVRETSSHPEVGICSLLLPHLIDAKDTRLVTSRATVVALAIHQIEEGTGEMTLEVEGSLHHINHNLLLTNMVELSMKRAKIVTMITTIKAEAIMIAADSAVAIQRCNSNRMNRQRNLAGSPIFVSQF